MDKKQVYEDLLKRTGLQDKQVISAYMYGSRVYGTARKDSDWDFIVTAYGVYNEQFSDNLINVNFYTPGDHLSRLFRHEPSAMECQYLSDDFILKNVKDPAQIDIDLPTLRHAYSAKASNSWVKAKKKLTVKKDYNDKVGKKSLWHSLRLLNFGCQIAEHKKIVDYSSMNYLYDEILYCHDWEELFEKYKKMYNGLCTEFKIKAPK